jgi:hypothetical protein
VLTLMGWTVGARILALVQLERVLQGGVTGVPEDAIQRMFTAAPMVWASIIPVGLMYPIGLLILGVTLFVARPVDRWIGALLAIGGVLFPLGRAVHLPWAWWSSDLLLAAAFALLGWQVLARPALWAGAEEADRLRQTYSASDAGGTADGLSRVQSL